MSDYGYLSESVARDRLARLKDSGQELVAQTYVGTDGFLHRVLCDGTTELILADDKPIYWVDVLDALTVYLQLYPDRRGPNLGPFAEWHTNVWPQMRQSGTHQ